MVLIHKDRSLCFGAGLILLFAKQKEIEVVIINKGDEVSFEEELAENVLKMITVFQHVYMRVELEK